ncbi:MAG: DUF2330 domain-containing protein [Planctomycetes bacterium]|nr:DUF2330 domain-containing protein [Planctomycetota bacterium]
MSRLTRPMVVAAVVVLYWQGAGWLDAACCYFSAKNTDILQPSQKVFITWDPARKLESFTVQPRFEGNARDFGMVIPTPSQPTLHEMPRGFFKHLAVYTILKQREQPASKLLPMAGFGFAGGGMNMMGGMAFMGGGFGMMGMGGGGMMGGAAPRPPAVKVLETGVVGSLDYKIIDAKRADDLFRWLKDNKYHYAGDEATLDHYVKKSWIFTVMKIDTMQMKKNKDGTFTGEVTPTRFQFKSDQLVYPLKITQISVKKSTEALFYVQAPYKVDLPGDMSYRYTWLPMLQAASGCTPGGIPGRGDDWLKAISGEIPAILRRGQALNFNFVSGQRPQPNKQGRTPTTMEWARKLTDQDIMVLQGKAPYSERVPNVDEGFTERDVRDSRRGQAVVRVIQARLAWAGKARPNGFLVRHAPRQDILDLRELAGHLQADMVITKFRKLFTRAEMDEDLLLVAADIADQRDFSEYEEILPSSPP